VHAVVVVVDEDDDNNFLLDRKPNIIIPSTKQCFPLGRVLTCSTQQQKPGTARLLQQKHQALQPKILL